MSVIIKKNQVLAFGPNGPAALPCGCGGNFCQPIQTNDTIRLQGTVTPATGVNLSDFARYSFDVSGDPSQGWGYASGKLYGINVPNDTMQAVSNNLNLQAGFNYAVYADITTYAAGAKHYYLLGVEFLSGGYINITGADITSTYPPDTVFTVIGTGLNDDISFTVIGSTYFPGVSPYTQIQVDGATTLESANDVWFLIGVSYAPVANEGYRLKINGEYLELPVISPDTVSGATSQAYLLRWNYISNSITDSFLRLETTNTDLIVIVKNIEVKQLSRVGIGTYHDGALISQLDNPTSLVTYYPTNTYVNNASGDKDLPFVPLIWNCTINFATFSGVIIGCSYLSLYDAALITNQIYNGTFDSDLDGWTAGTYWAYNSGIAKYTPPTSGSYSPGILSQTVTLTGGLKYDFGFSRSFGGTVSKVLVDAVISGGPTITLGTFTGPLGHNATLDLSTYTGNVTVTMRFKEVNQYEVIGIDDVTLTALAPDLFNLSNCIDTRASHDCTILFNAQNNDNAFGFVYSGGFQHTMRVRAKIDVTGYSEEVDTPYIFSNNDRVLMFARRDKEYTLFITDAPVHVHDLLTIMRLHDTFRIGTATTDLAEYVKDSAYQLNRRKSSTLKQATFTVRDKQGIGSNFPCG